MSYEPNETVLAIEGAVREHFAQDPRRLHHSLSTARMAVLLAQVYSVDEHQAAAAGLLHDWAKNIPVIELRTHVRKLNLPLTQDDLDCGRYDEVLHAPVGADLVFGLFPDLDPSVYSAIAKHTVAATQMNELESIIYVADMIDPSRDELHVSRSKREQSVYVSRLDSLREAVGTVSLDQLLFQCYRHSTVHLVEEGRPLYPNTTQVYNALLAGGACG